MRFRMLSLSIAVLVGCSHVTIRRVIGDDDVTGARFYRPWPYLLVSGPEVAADPKATATSRAATSRASIVYLPDLCNEYVIHPWVGLGSVEVKATLDDGWNLTSLGATQDSKIPEAITAFTGLLGGSAKLAERFTATRDGEPVPLAPGLYRLTLNENGLFDGLAPIKLDPNGETSAVPRDVCKKRSSR